MSIGRVLKSPRTGRKGWERPETRSEGCKRPGMGYEDCKSLGTRWDHGAGTAPEGCKRPGTLGRRMRRRRRRRKMRRRRRSRGRRRRRRRRRMRMRSRRRMNRRRRKRTRLGTDACHGTRGFGQAWRATALGMLICMLLLFCQYPSSSPAPLSLLRRCRQSVRDVQAQPPRARAK